MSSWLSDSSSVATILNSILNFFNTIRNYLEKKKNVVIYPSNQEKFRKTIEILKEHGLDKSPEVIQFFSANHIIIHGEKIGVVSKETSKDDIKNNLKESKEKELKQKINVVPITEIEGIIGLRTTKYVRKEIAKITEKLNPKHRSLITLSIIVENLYMRNQIDDAESIRLSINERYQEEGLKFCNLFQRGYLKHFMVSLAESQERDLDEKIDDFIKQKCENIFFIHKNMKIEDMIDVIKKINDGLQRKKEYIAIHSLGGAKPLAQFIINKVSMPENNDYEPPIEINKEDTKEKVGELSKIWYRQNGKEMLEYIKETIV